MQTLASRCSRSLRFESETRPGAISRSDQQKRSAEEISRSDLQKRSPDSVEQKSSPDSPTESGEEPKQRAQTVEELGI